MPNTFNSTARFASSWIGYNSIAFNWKISITSSMIFTGNMAASSRTSHD